MQNKASLARQACWTQWQDFAATPFAHALLLQERQLLHPLLEQTRGYYLLHISPRPWKELALAQGGLRHIIEWQPYSGATPSVQSFVADPAYLPFAEGTMDRVLLQHSLSLYHRPHQLLKEAARVLLPQGELWVLGFNPWGWQALCRFGPVWMQPQALRALQKQAWLTVARLKDWCEFLNLRCIAVYPSQGVSWPWQPLYLIRIEKQVGCPLTLGSSWSPSPAWLSCASLID